MQGGPPPVEPSGSNESGSGSGGEKEKLPDESPSAPTEWKVPELEEAKGKRRRICIYGGSFDPITFGHLAAITQVVNADVADEVWVVPCGHRRDKVLEATPRQRLQMCQIAIATQFPPSFPVKVSDVDVEEGNSIPSFRLFQLFSSMHPLFEFWLLIGEDLLECMPSWDDGENLMKHCRFLLLPRPPSPNTHGSLPCGVKEGDDLNGEPTFTDVAVGDGGGVRGGGSHEYHDGKTRSGEKRGIMNRGNANGRWEDDFGKKKGEKNDNDPQHEEGPCGRRVAVESSEISQPPTASTSDFCGTSVPQLPSAASPASSKSLQRYPYSVRSAAGRAVAERLTYLLSVEQRLHQLSLPIIQSTISSTAARRLLRSPALSGRRGCSPQNTDDDATRVQRCLGIVPLPVLTFVAHQRLYRVPPKAAAALALLCTPSNENESERGCPVTSTFVDVARMDS